MKKEILLYPALSTNEILVQFTGEVLLNKNLLITVPSDYVAFVFINQKLSARIEACSNTNLIKYLGKEYNKSLIKIAFVKTSDFPAIPWGFGDIDVKNAKLDETYRVGANGKFVIKIDDVSRLIKSFGSDDNITLESVSLKIKPIITSIGKPLLSKYFSNTLISVFEINALVDDLREKMLEAIKKEPMCAELGLQVFDLTINGIHVNEDDMELIRSKINKKDEFKENDFEHLENLKKEIIEALKNNRNDDLAKEIQKLKYELDNLVESQTNDTVLDEIDNLRVDMINAMKEINNSHDDSRIDNILEEISRLKSQLEERSTISPDKYINQNEELLNALETRLKNKIDSEFSTIKSIIENNIDESNQNTIPLYESAREERLKNLKLTTDLQLDKAESDDDFAAVAGLIYSNVENNLINTFKIPHKEKCFYMSKEEFDYLSSSLLSNDKEIFKDSYKPRYLEFKDLPGEYVEIPVEFRFIKAGLSTKNAIQAAKDWTVLNKLRHRSEENAEKLKNILDDRNMTKKEFLKYVLNYYRELKLYTRD